MTCPEQHEQHGGFTLLEMSIVLAIAGLLMAGLLPALTGQIELQRRNETHKQLEEIKEALIGYAIINGRLPCPASSAIATDTAGAGISDCSSSAGVLPWATLGVNETDAWGRRFTYAATSSFSSTNFTLASSGNLNVKASSTSASNLASNLPAILLSHGANGYGAYTPQGIQITTSADADEAENSNTNSVFVTHDLTPVFDDIVLWISPNILFNRMVTAGRLP